MKNKPFGIHIAPPAEGGRRLAIADIHGCFYTFQALIKRIQFSAADQLFILGDMINRGKRSRDVLDFILHLQTSGYNVHPVRGNHEQYLLRLIHESNISMKQPTFPNTSIHPLLDGKKVKPRYEHFLRDLPHYILSSDDYVLVHAGLNFSDDPLTSFDEMLFTREMQYRSDRIGGRKVLHGHTPTNMTEITDSIGKRSPVINLDNGCVYNDKKPQRGHLVCFKLDTYDLVLQRNID